MTGEQWRRLEALFLAAQDLPPGDRAGFAARETAGDSELHRELTGMLAQSATAGERISRAIEDVAQSMGPSAAGTGTHFGPYRIIREIGHGGMGIVFEAVRDDDEYSKTVAVKVAPWSRNLPMMRERFRLERQILAELEHPNIARFLDGGTADGVPYFVMEYVEGVPITDYCHRDGFDLRQRLLLFQQVCAAVHFAHESLVVHRDLKPANILVDEGGAPKLLDFGVAKLLDPLVDAGATAAALKTRATMTGGGTMWTPDYTSPEQVRGRAITVRTDVYSLGLILSELLCGERAQHGDLSSPSALEHSICVVDAALPSATAASHGDHALSRRLRGDVDTIVATAIRKEPERRYASVAALSDDIGRYLEGRPILARRSTFAYRASKLLSRHRAAAVAATLVAGSLVAGAVATLYQARRADRRFQQVRTLANAFVFDVHDRIATLPGATEARKAIVSTALTYLESLKEETGGDAALARELAGAYERVGSVQGHPLFANLGDTAGALASYGRAEAILKPLADGGDRAALLALVSVWENTASVVRAKGDVKGALAHFIRARDAGERLLAGTPGDRAVLDAAGDVYANLGRAQFELHDFAAAEQSGRRAMELAQQLVALEPANRNYQTALSTAQNTLGTTLISARRIEEAAGYYRMSIAARERLVDEDPNNLEYRRNLMVSYGNLGDVLGYRLGENLGDTAGATAAFEKAAAMADWAREHDPADRRALFDVVNAKLRLGSVLMDDDPPQPQIAQKHFDEASRVNAALLAADPGSSRYSYLAMTVDRRIGEAQLALGRPADAARSFEAVRSRAPALLHGPTGPNAHMVLVLATVRLAAIRARSGDRQAVLLADLMRDDLAARPIDSLATAAAVFGDLGRVYMTIAAGAPAAERSRRLRAAADHLQKSAEQWHAATLSPALEPRRAKALKSIEDDLALCMRGIAADRTEGVAAASRR